MKNMQDKTIGPDMRKEIIRQRYLRKDASGQTTETELQMYRRVAVSVAQAEANYGATEEQLQRLTEEFYRLMAERRFLPNSPTLMNAGRENGMLSACFVLPIEDNIEGIFDAVKNTALIQKAGGGTGFSFDKLRPTGDYISSSGGRTSGPISFWKVFSETTNAIQQGAFRRGANMGMMSVWHPDILKFLYAKQDLDAFTNYNISVKVTDAWMDQVKDNPQALHVVINPRTGKKYYLPRSLDIWKYEIGDLTETPASIEIKDGQKQARPNDANLPQDEYWTVGQVWEMLVGNAHKTGEPGLAFIDRINRDNSTPLVGAIEATNPCGEQPLLDHEACNLGSINLAEFVLSDGSDLDRESLAQTVELSIRFLDNVIDVGHWPTERVAQCTRMNRKIGLGVMGFAHTLILLGIRYNSDEAIEFARQVSGFIQEHSHQASEKLAAEKGTFPNWEGSIWDIKYNRPMRNAACTTIAPTGTISTITDCSSGVEPIFGIVFKRKALDGKEFIEFDPLVERLGKRQGWLTDVVREQLAQGVPPRGIKGIPPGISDVLMTAHQIAPEWHVRIQAAFQENVDNAVSKTVNLPALASIEDVEKVFLLAYELGCKGTTVYRDGCRENQVIATLNEESFSDAKLLTSRPRTRKTKGETTKFTMGCGKLYVTVNKDEHGLCEVFSSLGKRGGCAAQSEATCRIVSAALRSGVEPTVLIEQLKGIRCLSTISQRKANKDIDVLSCPDAISRAIEEALGQSFRPIETSSTNMCPDCRYPLRRESGCNICDNCGFSKCG